MSDVAISVRGLRKRYELGQLRGSFPTLRDEIARRLRRSDSGSGGQTRGELWALDGVDFDVAHGSAVGIVGDNGAGKTTLLKVLSRITPPTEGEITMHGRCAALLEVGAGFHPELSGRENIFLNGAILGMSRREIAAKLDDIVAFAEVERFVDTPVKRYSSGMYVRLAFSVAAHLEPDILIVDEVLAVGDAAFQRRCLGKLQEVTSVGRTVLVVSHNMAVIQNLTSRAIWLDHGVVKQTGDSQAVVRAYLAEAGASAGGERRDLRGADVRRAASKRGALRLAFVNVALVDEAGTPAASIVEGSSATFEIGVEVTEPSVNPEVMVRVRTDDGALLFTCFSGQLEQTLAPGQYVFDCRADVAQLRPGRYRVELAATTGGGVQDLVPNALVFEVEPAQLLDQNPRYLDGLDGVVRIAARWAVRPV